MAQIVGGFGVPHTPVFPMFVKRDGPDCEIAKLFGAQKNDLAATRPDVIVMFDTDHLNTFFLDNLPIFAMGVDKTLQGAERRAADRAELRGAVGARSRRAYPRGRDRGRLRRRRDAELLGRSFGDRAAAFPHAAR